MRKWIVGGLAGVLLLGGGALLFTRSGGEAAIPPPPPPQAQGSRLPVLGDPRPEPLAAAPGAREERRFARLDKNRSGTVDPAEYFETRQRAFVRLDVDRDGRLSFDEWSVRARERFAKADGDRSGALSREELASTAPARRARPRCDCPPTRNARAPAEDDEAQN